MCGGTLEIATCSHVGHVFRKSTPYTFPGGTSKIVNHNNARLAEVWLDQWKYFYYNINPGSTNIGEKKQKKKKKRNENKNTLPLALSSSRVRFPLALSRFFYFAPTPHASRWLGDDSRMSLFFLSGIISVVYGYFTASNFTAANCSLSDTRWHTCL